MRILLATAVAIAPLLAASGAMAEVVISTARTTPITTSNATGSGPDDIRFSGSGSIAVSSGVAVTVDTSDNVTIDSGGSILMATAADGATGVLVNPGLTSNVTVNGSISIGDTIGTYPDTDNDGDIDGPWATGTGRYGIRYAAGAPVTGNLVVGTTGVISVDGNNSYGISVESGLIGNLTSQGNIRVFGDNSIAVRTTGSVSGSVSGNVALLGTVQARGANASAVSIGGDVGGRLTLQGDISASGYRYTGLGNSAFEAGLEGAVAQSRVAIAAGADVALQRQSTADVATDRNRRSVGTSGLNRAQQSDVAADAAADAAGGADGDGVVAEHPDVALAGQVADQARLDRDAVGVVAVDRNHACRADHQIARDRRAGRIADAVTPGARGPRAVDVAVIICVGVGTDRIADGDTAIDRDVRRQAGIDQDPRGAVCGRRHQNGSARVDGHVVAGIDGHRDSRRDRNASAAAEPDVVRARSRGVGRRDRRRSRGRDHDLGHRAGCGQQGSDRNCGRE